MHATLNGISRIFGLASLAVILMSGAAVPEAPCELPIPHVLVDTGRHELRLCRGKKEVESFRVALGRGGTGKTREGDGKTPLGLYPLAAPRRSPGYGTFILVGYPTAEQAAEGYTGSAVGVHGPKRMRYPWLGFVASFVDWTAGCIALGSDEEVDRIAEWVKRHPKAPVVLR